MDSFVVNIGKKDAFVIADNEFTRVLDADGNPALIEIPVKGEIITHYDDDPALVVKIDFTEVCNNIKKYFDDDATVNININIIEYSSDQKSIYIAMEYVSFS